MNTIKAIIRIGRIETELPLDFPDGIELMIPLPNGIHEVDRSMAAEEFAVTRSANSKPF